MFTGSNGNAQIRHPEDTGPRRGDITPERDMDYRPVRSVDRLLSRVDTRYPTLDQTAKENDHQKDLRQQLPKKPRYTGFELLARRFENLNQIYHRNKQSRNIINEMQNEKDLEKETTHKDQVKRRFMSARNTLKRLFGIMDLKQNKSDNLIGAQNVTTDHSDLPTLGKLHNGDHSYRGYLRVRRQIGTAITEQPTTENETRITTTEAVSNETTSAQTQPQSSDIPSNDSSDTTSDPDETSPDGGISTTQPTEKAPTTTGSPTTEYEDEDSTPCQGIPSNFGRYGVLAFSVTLAVAFLLLYAILMIIFMPKIMARRKEKSNVSTVY